MKCSEVRTLFSQVTEKGNPPAQVPQADLDFLVTNGYLSRLSKPDYDQASAEVTNLMQMNQNLQNESVAERTTAVALQEEEKKTHSIFFYFEGKDKKAAETQILQSERDKLAKEEADIADMDSKIAQIIQKKSMMDRMVPYDGQFLALTGLGMVTLNDLNVKNYRLSDSEFADYVEETRDTWQELRSIADRGSYFASDLRTKFPKTDPTEVWSVAIGLGKLQGDQTLIDERFLLAMSILERFKSTIENKMMAAEIMTSLRTSPSQSPSDNSDLQSYSKSLVNLSQEVRQHSKVPKQLSAGIAAIILAGKKFDGTYPTDRFEQYSKLTPSYESAAILSVLNVPSDQLTGKFQSFRQLFSSWGYQVSEDTELASAYLSISDLGAEDVMTKLAIVVDALKNYLEYPLVAGAILTSIATLEANETLDLMEKAVSLLSSYGTGFQRSQLVSLAVRMIHGIRNEIVKQLDSTATIMKTPVQFRYYPSYGFVPFYLPLVIAHSTYFSTFSGIGGAHPAHVHGVGGFMG